MAMEATKRRGGPIPPDGFYLPSEAAEKVGVSVRTLRRWRVKQIFVPKHGMDSGNLFVNLYTEEDIRAMEALKGEHDA